MSTLLDQRVREHLRHVRRLVQELDADPPEDGGASSWAAFARDVLDERHGVELALRAANATELDDDTLALLVEADELLSAQLFRLLVLNEHRRKKLGSISPAERNDYWWYSRGAALPADAVRHLGDVAALLAAFPEARRELEALSRAEELLTQRSERPRVSAPSWGQLAPAWSESAVEEAPNEESRPRGRSSAPRQHVTLWLFASAALFLLGVGGAIAWHNAVERAEREKAALQAQLADAEKAASDQVSRLQSQLEDAGTMSQVQLDALRVEIARAEKKASEAVNATESAGGSQRPSRPVRVRSSASSSGSSCAPGDPMCGGL